MKVFKNRFIGALMAFTIFFSSTAVYAQDAVSAAPDAVTGKDGEVIYSPEDMIGIIKDFRAKIKSEQNKSETVFTVACVGGVAVGILMLFDIKGGKVFSAMAKNRIAGASFILIFIGTYLYAKFGMINKKDIYKVYSSDLFKKLSDNAYNLLTKADIDNPTPATIEMLGDSDTQKEILKLVGKIKKVVHVTINEDGTATVEYDGATKEVSKYEVDQIISNINK
jgi:hypothetical protein